MDALTLLMKQHREVEKLFEQFEAADDDDRKLEIFEKVADAIAVHATIEETYFYPALRSKGTREDLAEAYDEHNTVKQLLQTAMKSTDAPGFDGCVAAVKGALLHHVEEEESSLFKKARGLLDKDQFDDIGQKMQDLADDLWKKGDPRKSIKPAKMPAPA
jgi:hemerythrin superfamily protein